MHTLTRLRLPLLALAGLAAGTAVGGGTLALWNASGSADGATITAGDLDVTTEPARWQETSSDVDDAPRTIDPADFLVRRGDTVAADYDVTIDVEGDNMRATLRVSWEDAPDLPAGVTGTYHLVDGDGDDVGSTLPVGDDGVLLDGVEAAAGTETGYTLRIELDFAGLDDRFGSGSAAQIADLGAFTATVEQIRSGGDFE